MEKLTAVIAALDAGATKASVCRTFGIPRSTLVNSLARIGWSAGIHTKEEHVAHRRMLTEDQISQLFEPPIEQRALIRHYTLASATWR